jgi:hypothetical protein
MTDFRALCAELTDSLEEWLSSNSIGGISLDDGTDAELIYRAQAALAQPAPQRLTVQDYANMEKHAQSFIEESGGLLTLDGCFTREELLELANSLPASEAT